MERRELILFLIMFGKVCLCAQEYEVIQHPKINDKKAIAEIMQKSYAGAPYYYGWSVNEYILYLDVIEQYKDFTCYTLCKNTQIIGAAMSFSLNCILEDEFAIETSKLLTDQEKKEHFYLAELVIDPAFQGKGLSHKILRAFFANAQYYHKTIIAAVMRDKKLEQFWQHMGFSLINRNFKTSWETKVGNAPSQDIGYTISLWEK